MTTKKCTKKRDARAKFVVLLIKPIAFVAFPSPSPSSDLKVPKIARGVLARLASLARMESLLAGSCYSENYQFNIFHLQSFGNNLFRKQGSAQNKTRQDCVFAVVYIQFEMSFSVGVAAIKVKNHQVLCFMRFAQLSVSMKCNSLVFVATAPKLNLTLVHRMKSK